MPKGEYLQYGGQAIIEGVMMRSPRYFAVACRAPNGEIVLDSEPLEKTWIGRQKWLKLPFFRGTWALLDAMTLGVKAMRFAANVQMAPEYQKEDEAPAVPEPKPMWIRVLTGIVVLLLGLAMLAVAVGPFVPYVQQRRVWQLALVVVGIVFAWSGFVSLYNALTGKEETAESQKRVQDMAVGATVVFSLVFGMFLFNYVPNAIAETFFRGRDVRNGTIINYGVETIKVVFFIGYISLIAQMKEIKEVFKYHGAEHKAINTLEAHQPLEMEYCRKQTRLHPRCGTSFAIIVLIVSFILMPLVPRYWITGGQGANWLLDVTARFFLEIFLLLPIVAGIAYELIRFAGKFRNTAFVNVLFQPGLMSQYMTTREPRDDQIEVALTALKACIDQEESHDARERG
ncbi:MAG TPA: DUF1385 domain-containing protein, partial [Fimbriimonas sp.]